MTISECSPLKKLCGALAPVGSDIRPRTAMNAAARQPVDVYAGRQVHGGHQRRNRLVNRANAVVDIRIGELVCHGAVEPRPDHTAIGTMESHVAKHPLGERIGGHGRQGGGVLLDLDDRSAGQLGQDRVLGAEVPVQGRAADTGGRGDLLHADGVVTAFGEQRRADRQHVLRNR